MGSVSLTLKTVGGKTLVTYASLLLATSFIMVLVSSIIITAIGFYDEITHPDVEGRRIVVLTGYSVAPFTSVIRKDRVEEIFPNITDVAEFIDYEILAPAIVNGEGVVVRGPDPEFLRTYVGYRVLSGSDLDPSCLDCAWVSPELAEKLGLELGDVVVAEPVLGGRPVLLRIKGILDIAAPYRNEVLVSRRTGQMLRGVYGETYSIVVIVVKPGISELSVGGKPIDLTLLEQAFIALRLSGRNYSIDVSRYLSSIYVSRLGINRDALLAVALSVMLVASLGSCIIGEAIVISSWGKLSVLHEQGVSLIKIKAAIIPLALTPLISLYLYELLLGLNLRVFELKALTYTLTPKTSLLLIAVPLINIICFIVGVLRSNPSSQDTQTGIGG